MIGYGAYLIHGGMPEGEEIFSPDKENFCGHTAAWQKNLKRHSGGGLSMPPSLLWGKIENPAMAGWKNKTTQKIWASSEWFQQMAQIIHTGGLKRAVPRCLEEDIQK